MPDFLAGLIGTSVEMAGGATPDVTKGRLMEKLATGLAHCGSAIASAQDGSRHVSTERNDELGDVGSVATEVGDCVHSQDEEAGARLSGAQYSFCAGSTPHPSAIDLDQL